VCPVPSNLAPVGWGLMRTRTSAPGRGAAKSPQQAPARHGVRPGCGVLLNQPSLRKNFAGNRLSAAISATVGLLLQHGAGIVLPGRESRGAYIRRTGLRPIVTLRPAYGTISPIPVARDSTEATLCGWRGSPTSI
jgi:hypothetical protein